MLISLDVDVFFARVVFPFGIRSLPRIGLVAEDPDDAVEVPESDLGELTGEAEFSRSVVAEDSRSFDGILT